MNKGIEKETAVNAFLSLLKAGSCISGLLSRHRMLDHLTFSQFGVLDLLRKKGPLNQKEIAASLNSSGSNIVTVVDNLEKHNLVERRRDGRDRRIVIVKLTEHGFKKITEVYPKHVETLKEKFSILTEEEALKLNEICIKLTR